MMSRDGGEEKEKEQGMNGRMDEWMDGCIDSININIMHTYIQIE